MIFTRIFLLYILYSVLLSIHLSSCSGSKVIESETFTSSLYDSSNSEVHTFPAKAHSIFDIVKEIDLNGQTYKLPEGVTIRQKGGIIKNGTLIGNKTKIISNKYIFNKVSIQGSWCVKDISTNLFADLNYNNSLRDVLALANKDIKNRVTINKGIYNIYLDDTKRTDFSVPSNTDLIIDGNINLVPNNLPNYVIVAAKGHNINISGKGCIIGDKDKHTDTTGEWGMGLYVNGEYVHVRDITIKDCWGDCIYIGQKSKNVYIDRCILDNGRRQGISITSAKNVYVMNCIIKNVHGTLPQYAIDMEPNKGDTVTNVYIQNTQIINCVGGITANGGSKNAYLGDIYIEDCIVDENVKSNSYQFFQANKVTLTNSKAKNKSRKIMFSHINIVESKMNKVGGKANQESYSECNIVNGKRIPK